MAKKSETRWVIVGNVGTALDRFLTDSAFRRGFADVRAGLAFADEYETRSKAWQWMYESGRLFAASGWSRRWKEMPSDRRKVSKELQRCYMRSKGSYEP